MGVLVGFVMGAVLGNPGSSLKTGDASNAQGSVMNISRFGNSASVTDNTEVQPSDTVALCATDENGKEMQILIIK